jgi:hypothetical protein
LNSLNHEAEIATKQADFTKAGKLSYEAIPAQQKEI